MTFKQPFTLEALNQTSHNTLVQHLGITFTAAGDDWLQATMPVDTRTKQPLGLLHGGASVALAETLGSIAGNLYLDPTTHTCVGLEINANHIRGARQGIVTGTARPTHIGRSTHVWEIRIENEKNQLICLSRITLAIIPLP